MGQAGRQPVISAGVLAWRGPRHSPEFLLAHPGGPYWAGKDAAAWSIPKGLVEAGEADWDAALREFEEELGLILEAEGEALPPCRQRGGKELRVWLVAADLEVSAINSNTFEIEWPPRSGVRRAFPEVDRAQWFDAETAAFKIHKGQRPILTAALERIAGR